MKNIVIDLNSYESGAEIRRVATWWNDEFGGVLINRYNKVRITPCTFKHIVSELKLDEFEKLRLIRDGLEQILRLIETDKKYSLYYTKNFEAILALELAGTKHYDKYLSKIPAEDLLNAKLLDQALSEMQVDLGPMLRLV